MTHVRLLLTATAFCVGTGIAAAQVDRATLSGVVRDPSGGVIPAATIKVTSLATGVTQDATATNRGTYLVVNLAPGQYLVEGSATGFQTLAQTVALEVGQRGALDLTLPVGGLGETVTVEGITPLLDTQSAVLGSVVSNIEVSKLPLAIRNWDDLLFLLPGVQGDRYTEESGGTATGRTGGLNVHGNRSLQNNFLLDGVDNNSISTNVQELSTQVSRPSVDAIGEFKIVTSPFAAEYGRSPGAAVSVTTKSGTNRLAGTAYYFGRDERFDSNTFFSNRAGLAKPTNNQIQFGGNAGGPIVKSRLFFFGDYEGTRIDRGVIRTGRVPTEAERQGIFSGTVIDPLSGQPFANATIPRARFDPVALNILNLVPLPNTTGGNNFIRQPEVQDDNDRYLARVDFKASGNDSIFGRYSYNDRTRFVPGWFGGVLDGTSTSAWGRNLLRLAELRRRLDQGAERHDGQRGPGVVGKDEIGRTAGSVRQQRHGDDRVQRRAGQSCGGWRDRRRRHYRLHPLRLAQLHAQVPAHRSVGVPRHVFVAEGQAPVQVRRQPADADEQRLLRHPVDARQRRLPGAVHRQRLRRLPARVCAPGRTVERVGGQPAPVVDELLRPGRLAADQSADAEPRPALRLHDADARGRERAGQLQSGNGDSCFRARTATWRRGRRSSPTPTTSRRVSASSTS